MAEDQLHKYGECKYTVKTKLEIRKGSLSHNQTEKADEIEEQLSFLQCLYCSYKTREQSDMNKHCLTHPPTEMNRKSVHVPKKQPNGGHCHLCPYKARTVRLLNLHLRSHHIIDENQTSMLECTQCNYKTWNNKCFDRHLDDHKSSEELRQLNIQKITYKCEKCAYKSMNRHDMESHTRVYLRLTEIQQIEPHAPMSECSDTTKKHSGLSKSLEEHHLRKKQVKLQKLDQKSIKDLSIWKCKNCSFTTKRPSDLTKHLRTHQKNSQLKNKQLEKLRCKMCGYCTNLPSQFDQHMVIHLYSEKQDKSGIAVPTLMCKNCSFTTTKRSDLSKHLRTHTSLEEHQLKRKQITDNLQNSLPYQNSEDDPKSIKQISTLQCKIFNNIEESRDHNKISDHAKTNFPSTNATKKKSPVYRRLIRHKTPQNLLDQKPEWMCQTCGYETLNIEDLYRHSAVHDNAEEGQKSLEEISTWTCQICGFHSKEKSKYKRHLVVHLSIEHRHKIRNQMLKWICKICLYTTKQHSDFKKHMLTHKSPENLLKKQILRCEVCGYCTDLLSHFDIHFVTHLSIEKTHFGQTTLLCQRPDGNKQLMTKIRLKTSVCGICGYSAPSAPQFERHLLVHLPIDELQKIRETHTLKCQHCSFITKKRSHLKTHILTHELLEKPVLIKEQNTFNVRKSLIRQKPSDN